MILRKVNAVLSLLTTLLLLDHAIFQGARMLSRGSIVSTADIMPRILAGLMMLHAVISIVLAILGHKGAEKREVKSYPKLNKATVFQRVSGILLIFLTALHIAGTAGPLRPPFVIHAILPPLFFAVALMHAALSTSKAFITLGVGNARVIQGIDVVMKVLCGLTLVACVTGFYLYLV